MNIEHFILFVSQILDAEIQFIQERYELIIMKYL